MSRRPVFSLLTVLLFAAVAACETASGGGGGSPSVIHPQPQPNSGKFTFTAPCTSEVCGSAPESLASPRCKQEAAACMWSENMTVSYAPCAESACGVAPGADVCPAGTTFKSNSCGNENDAGCKWNTFCAPPRSTTACSNPDGCGGKPEIGVICQDGGLGDLACMKFATGCDWQPTCE